jgi:hypothetical protein
VVATRAGRSVNAKCEISGISPRTFQRWMTSDRPEHHRLQREIREAEADCITSVEAGIMPAPCAREPAVGSKCLGLRFLDESSIALPHPV